MYRLSRPCVLTNFAKFGNKDEAKTSFLVPEIKKLTTDARVNNLDIIIISKGWCCLFHADTYICVFVRLSFCLVDWYTFNLSRFALLQMMLFIFQGNQMVAVVNIICRKIVKGGPLFSVRHNYLQDHIILALSRIMCGHCPHADHLC